MSQLLANGGDLLSVPFDFRKTGVERLRPLRLFLFAARYCEFAFQQIGAARFAEGFCRRGRPLRIPGSAGLAKVVPFAFERFTFLFELRFAVLEVGLQLIVVDRFHVGRCRRKSRRRDRGRVFHANEDVDRPNRQPIAVGDFGAADGLTVQKQDLRGRQAA